MKITVAKKDMQEALQIAAIGAVGKDDEDQSAHFVFRLRDEKVEILSYNHRICTSTVLTCQVEGEDKEALTIPAWRLIKWVNGNPEAALTFESEQGQVMAKGPRSRVPFNSMDPSQFRYWDKTLAESKKTTTVDSDKLSSALKYASHFISDQDTRRPEIAQAEVIKGSLWATDKKAVTVIELEALRDASFRVHGKDISLILRFLALPATESVDVLEHDRMVFFRRADGSLVGASRPLPEFPTLNLDASGDDAATWVASSEHLLEAFECLAATAAVDNTVVRFRYDSNKDKVGVSVESGAGGEGTHLVDGSTHENITSHMENEGFECDYPYIKKIIGHFGGDDLSFGLNETSRGGFTRFRHVADGDRYITVVVWRQ